MSIVDHSQTKHSPCYFALIKRAANLSVNNRSYFLSLLKMISILSQNESDLHQFSIEIGFLSQLSLNENDALGFIPLSSQEQISKEQVITENPNKGIDEYDVIINFFNDLCDLSIYFFENDISYRMPFITSFAVNPSNKDVVDIEINKNLMGVIGELIADNPFDMFNEYLIFNLDQRGFALLQLIADYAVNNTSFVVSADEIRDRFNAKGLYQNSAEFNRNVLDKAIKSLSRYIDLGVSYIGGNNKTLKSLEGGVAEGSGRKTTHYEFSINDLDNLKRCFNDKKPRKTPVNIGYVINQSDLQLNNSSIFGDSTGVIEAMPVNNVTEQSLMDENNSAMIIPLSADKGLVATSIKIETIHEDAGSIKYTDSASRLYNENSHNSVNRFEAHDMPIEGLGKLNNDGFVVNEANLVVGAVGNPSERSPLTKKTVVITDEMIEKLLAYRPFLEAYSFCYEVGSAKHIDFLRSRFICNISTFSKKKSLSDYLHEIEEIENQQKTIN